MAGAVDHLQLELDYWKEAGVCPQLFLRDDDCVDVTPELKSLVQFIERRDIPLLLAVIPKFATEALGEFIADHKLITPAVHGYSHTNHAGEDQKKCEFGDGRDQGEMLDEMKRGRQMLGELFAERLSPLFVPPWNRIGEKAIAVSVEAGFGGLSGFGWKPQGNAPRWVNTHIDVIDWKNGKAKKSIDMLINELRMNLMYSRQRNFAPVGILTHHLVQKDWETLGEVIDALGKVKWV